MHPSQCSRCIGGLEHAQTRLWISRCWHLHSRVAGGLGREGLGVAAENAEASLTNKENGSSVANRDFVLYLEDLTRIAGQDPEAQRLEYGINAPALDGQCSPFQSYVQSLGSWWRNTVKYLKECYPSVGFSALCNTGVALNRIRKGQWMVLGLSPDGKEARCPRPGVPGPDLDFNELGEAWNPAD